MLHYTCPLQWPYLLGILSTSVLPPHCGSWFHLLQNHTTRSMLPQGSCSFIDYLQIINQGKNSIKEFNKFTNWKFTVCLPWYGFLQVGQQTVLSVRSLIYQPMLNYLKLLQCVYSCSDHPLNRKIQATTKYKNLDVPQKRNGYKKCGSFKQQNTTQLLRARTSFLLRSTVSIISAGPEGFSLLSPPTQYQIMFPSLSTTIPFSSFVRHFSLVVTFSSSQVEPRASSLRPLSLLTFLDCFLGILYLFLFLLISTYQ